MQMHYILKLQLEPTMQDPRLYKIVNHLEIHSTTDMLSQVCFKSAVCNKLIYMIQVPIIGGFYSTSIRNAVGQLSLAGTALLDYAGLLDLVPDTVDRVGKTASSTAHSLSARMEQLASLGMATGDRALRYAGLSGLVISYSQYIKATASSLLEEGRG